MPALRVAGWYPATVQAWTPLAWTAEERAVQGERILNVIARLKPGVDRLRAQAEMDTLVGRLAQEYPETDKGWDAIVQPLHDSLTIGRRLPPRAFFRIDSPEEHTCPA
jgi:hypothetical protein